ncbi:unnamed protein product [Zymoseptoria tritici ST99CH_3D1]|nr:unnamed protein product [Zymoseptoria tritici ST99CH_3D1]
MPQEGIQLSPDRDILTTPEIYYLSALFVNQGVTKIRLTGGEPTVRKDIVPLMKQIGSLRRHGLQELALTTNGISLHRKLEDMVEAGLTGVNISLDTLDKLQFPLLTRRNGFDAVMKSINRVQEMNKLGAGINLKINCVAMRGVNDDQILPFVEMTREQDLEVRFIEYMPFGGNKWSQKKMLPYAELVEIIRSQYPDIGRLQDGKSAVSKTWQVPGFKGRIGFITSMTNDFCGSCNRLRITSDGNLKVCLHGNTEVSLRDLLRDEHDGEPMDEAAFEAIRQIEMDRRQPNGIPVTKGWISKERQLLEVIGAAVKRKQEKHAGMGELENMTNRPMILIGEGNASSRRIPRSIPPAFMSPTRSTPTWSRLPLHMLPGNGSLLQPRFYSTSRDGEIDPESAKEPHFEQYMEAASADTEFTEAVPADQALKETPTTEADHTENLTPSISPPEVGFQSLSGLFVMPERRRSKPVSEEMSAGRENSPQPERISTATGSTEFRPFSAGREVPIQSNRASVEAPSPKFKPLDASPRQHVPADVPSSFGVRTPDSFRGGTPRSVGFQNTENTGIESGGRAARRQIDSTDAPKSITRWIDSDSLRRGSVSVPVGRVPNPFASDKPADVQSNDARLEEHANGRPSTAWGLNSAHQPPETSDDASHDRVEPDTGAKITERGPTFFRLTPSHTMPEANVRPSPAAPAAASTPGDPPIAAGLTHVKSNGEARMVDVGNKQSTKRVAVAVGGIRFSDPETIKLILEDKNKKGDVLGTARIAGIMAAKKTSDLIPLCHPIALTKVDVDLRLIVDHAHFDCVQVQVHVECQGPTGVEMEAIMAVNGAALTIYDMCKAVDRDMSTLQSRVVHKSGGRSGTYSQMKWLASSYGQSWTKQFAPEWHVTTAEFDAAKHDALQAGRFKRYAKDLESDSHTEVYEDIKRRLIKQVLERRMANQALSGSIAANESGHEKEQSLDPARNVQQHTESRPELENTPPPQSYRSDHLLEDEFEDVMRTIRSMSETQMMERWELYKQMQLADRRDCTPRERFERRQLGIQLGRLRRRRVRGANAANQASDTRALGSIPVPVSKLPISDASSSRQWEREKDLESQEGPSQHAAPTSGSESTPEPEADRSEGPRNTLTKEQSDYLGSLTEIQLRWRLSTIASRPGPAFFQEDGRPYGFTKRILKARLQSLRKRRLGEAFAASTSPAADTSKE